MVKHWIAVAAISMAACGSKSSDERDERERGTAAKATEPKAAPQLAEADLFAGATVALPTPAAKLRLGMTEAEAKAAAPEIISAKYGYEVPDTKGTKIVAQFERGKLWNVRIELRASQDAAKTWLAKKWGEPVATKNSIGTPEYTWNAPAAHLRATLEQRASASTVYFAAIIARDELLGADPKHLGFETAPLVGASAEDAKKAFAAYDPQPRTDDPNTIQLSFPPIETEPHGYASTLVLRVKNGKVTGYTFTFIAGDMKDTDAFAAKLEGMYGKGKLDDLKLYTDYPGGAKAEIAKDLTHGSVLWVGDYRQ
jgi:hypothetical protein